MNSSTSILTSVDCANAIDCFLETIGLTPQTLGEFEVYETGNTSTVWRGAEKLAEINVSTDYDEHGRWLKLSVTCIDLRKIER